MLPLPATQHPYQYALNNPLRYTDPSGESPLLVAVGLIAASAALAGTAELLFNQLPDIMNRIGGYRGLLQAVRCGQLDDILRMIDIGALAGAVTNALIAGALATFVVFAIPILISALHLSGFSAVAASLALHWVYGGLIGFTGGIVGAVVKSVVNRQSFDYTLKDAQADFIWGSVFLFSGAAIGHFTRWTIASQFRKEAASIATAMSQGGVPHSNTELQRISWLAIHGAPKNIGNASLFPPGVLYVTPDDMGMFWDLLLNDNYWKEWWTAITN